MATVADILKYIESIAPMYMAEEWDKVGLNCGRRDREVKKILVAMDPFPHVCREAVEFDADLLVTHHPLVWENGFITDATTQGQCILELLEHGIAHIGAHTNWDCAPGGVNDTLAAILGLKDIQVIDHHNNRQKDRQRTFHFHHNSSFLMIKLLIMIERGDFG